MSKYLSYSLVGGGKASYKLKVKPTWDRMPQLKVKVKVKLKLKLKLELK